MPEEPKGDWIQTYTGKTFYPLSPSPEDIDIKDIAHALSMLCRYNGHTTEFYSVAEHSQVMSLMVDHKYALEALLHDAAEAYVSDVARPVKPMLSGFKEIENRVDGVIREKFSVGPRTDAVKFADLRMLATERNQVMRKTDCEWGCIEGVEPFDVTLGKWGPTYAEAAFLQRFKVLTAKYVTLHTPCERQPGDPITKGMPFTVRIR